MSERWTRTVDPGGRDVLMRVNGSRGVEYLEWMHDGDLPQDADPLGEIAAALNAAAQLEQRPTPEKIPGTESYSYPLSDRVQSGINAAFARHQPAAAQHAERDELLRDMAEVTRGYRNLMEDYADWSTDCETARKNLQAAAGNVLARFNALNATEEDGG